MAAKNPYDLLGVAKTATDKEIRSAYRKLAKKLHPDVNPDDAASAERFKEVTAAYNLLSNEELRKQYDSGAIDEQGQQRNPFAGAGGFGQRGQGPGYNTGFGGFEGFGARGGSGGGRMGQDDMSDLFGSLFGMNTGPFSGGMRGGMNRPPVRRKGADIQYTVNLSLPESLRGGLRQLPSGTKVRIPAGIRDGQSLRVRGKGEPGTGGGPAGDAKVRISVRPHPNLARDGDDLHLRLPISLGEALRGGSVRIDMPSGAVSLKIKPGSNTGQKMRLKGKGATGKNKVRGNLIVELVIMLTEAELAQADDTKQQIGDENGAVLRQGLIGN
ncbi:DnaJ C-terminal domain-containing protein [Algimonas porphyrae]|uniref:Molecular chaperone DnaJ n=1 Tax=Algimonas porphyrae TaxID=1128113 RepID=A0ABQ5V082_9PROT|nr:DnaJ C-terminal domain-containing protein [Algimonas porphyrae]GLQ19657.1 molecular chaperone DnaJ [Algimonas porphyrae]